MDMEYSRKGANLSRTHNKTSRREELDLSLWWNISGKL